MGPLEEKPERLEQEKARLLLNDLIQRGRVVGIRFGQIVRRIQADKGYHGVLKEICSREANQKPKYPLPQNRPGLTRPSKGKTITLGRTKPTEM